MFVAICYFSLDTSSDSRLFQRIKDKVFAKFKLILTEVEEGGESVLAGALVNNDEHYLRSFFDKILKFIEESEGVRIENERLEVIQK